jgi:aspartate/methionine/tyrosine aminotransferase
MQVLSQIYGPEMKRTLTADKEVLITQGANQGIFAIFQTYLAEGDEVILIEPYFDIYRPAVTL